MSADLDRLVELVTGFARATGHDQYPVPIDTIRRIAADYATLEAERDEARAGLESAVRRNIARVKADQAGGIEAERDRWRAIANRLGEALDDVLGEFCGEEGTTDRETTALDAWRAAKEEAQDG